MLTYNTRLKKLTMPEYGRNIQQMVDHCLTIEDRDERSRCARSIIKSMGNLFPELRNGEENQKKLWGHLAIMSGFKLDIDYPCEIIQPDNLHTLPEKLHYSDQEVKRRVYGKTIVSMIDQASSLQPGEERDALVRMIASQMKKALIAVNKDGIDDSRVFRDLAEISHGEIRLNADDVKLHDYIIPEPPTGKKKKKK